MKRLIPSGPSRIIPFRAWVVAIALRVLRRSGRRTVLEVAKKAFWLKLPSPSV